VRSGLDSIGLLYGVARRDFYMVAAWSVDRLGRSLQHLLALLGELKAKSVDAPSRAGAGKEARPSTYR